MVVINRSSLDKAQFGCIYGGDALKPTNSSQNLRQRPLSPTFFDESQSWNKGRTTKKRSGVLSWLLRIVTVGAFYLLYMTYSELEERKTELSIMQEDFQGLNENLIVTKSELKSSEQLFVELKQKLDDVRLQKGVFDDGVDLSNLTEELRSEVSGDIVSRQKALTKRVLDLQETIKILHRKEVIERFGKGPTFFVEFAVSIEGRTKYFSVETAPVTLMPHAVHTFLHAVDEGLWNDTVFLHKNKHILQAAPQNSKGKSKVELLDSEARLVFPEYAADYSHSKYSLGFAGRPGGPSFYINISDNTQTHGPGGQVHHILHEEADACFAKVFRGHSVVDALVKLSENSNKKNPSVTIIKSAKMITPKR